MIWVRAGLAGGERLAAVGTEAEAGRFRGGTVGPLGGEGGAGAEAAWGAWGGAGAWGMQEEAWPKDVNEPWVDSDAMCMAEPSSAVPNVWLGGCPGSWAGP